MERRGGRRKAKKEKEERNVWEGVGLAMVWSHPLTPPWKVPRRKEFSYSAVAAKYRAPVQSFQRSSRCASVGIRAAHTEQQDKAHGGSKTYDTEVRGSHGTTLISWSQGLGLQFVTCCRSTLALGAIRKISRRKKKRACAEADNKVCQRPPPCT